MKYKWLWVLPGITVSALFGGAVLWVVSSLLFGRITAVTGVKQLVALIVALYAAFFLAGAYMIYQKRKNERKLLTANRRYEGLIANIQGGVITCLFDPKTGGSRTLYMSEGWTTLTGYTPEDLNTLLNGNPQAVVLPEDRELANREYLEQTAAGNSYKLQYRAMRKDGTIIWVIDRGTVSVTEDGSVLNQSIVTEVTDIKEQEEQLRKMAQTDPLTGLCNKSTTKTFVENFLSRSCDGLNALMMLDIDNFKDVNDSFGHIFGDTVLIEVSDRLRRLFRAQDVIGRIGGDEFLVLMAGISSKEAAAIKAEEVCAAFRSTFIGVNGSFKISCSLGIALSTESRNFNELFGMADTALYDAKTKGKDQFAFYSGDETMRASSCDNARRNQTRESDSGSLGIKERIFELLYNSVDFNSSVHLVLSLFGRIPDLGRAYVFENDRNNRFAHNTYEWCAGGVPSIKDSFPPIPIAELRYYETLFDENDIFCCYNIDGLSPKIAALWQPGRAHALMQVAIRENGVIRGFVGCDNLEKADCPNNENFSIINFAAKVIGVFILKRRTEERASQPPPAL